MLRILLVEDSRDVLPRMVRCLCDIEGISLLATAGSIELARQFIEELLPDLLLLDLSLSDGNAADCIAAFGALAPAMDIAIHSNDASAFTRQKCLDAGAKWFFDKSGELEDLIGFVQERALLAA